MNPMIPEAVTTNIMYVLIRADGLGRLGSVRQIAEGSRIPVLIAEIMFSTFALIMCT